MIEILRITAPFGIKGAVCVVLFTDNIKHYKRLFDSAGNEIAFKVLQDNGKSAVLSLDGVSDRNKAESLRGCRLFVQKSDMPELDPNQVFIDDLLGQTIKCSESGLQLTIVAVDNFGAGDLIELADENKSRFYVPFTEENFPEIDGEMYLAENAYNWFKN